MLAGYEALPACVQNKIGSNKAEDNDNPAEDDDQQEIRPLGVMTVVNGGSRLTHTTFRCSLRRRGIPRSYSSLPGRAMRSRMASLGDLLWWRIASICSVIGISTP